jgi:4-hydroxy-tetrahydrodipicolinate synthase
MAHVLASGIIAAPVLPFERNGAVDWAALDRYIPAVVAGGPSGLAINMDASEGASLSPEEQLAVLRRCKALVDGACPVISGVMATYTGGAVDLARRLVDAGADALAIFAPLPVFMGRPLPLQMVVDYHSAVAEAVKAPLIAFQFPLSFVDYPKGTITALSKIEAIVSMKEASFDIERTALAVDEAAAAPRRIGILTGSDTFILEAMLLGCDGALIGFAATFTAELVRMQKLAAAGDANGAYAIWRELGPLARHCWGAPLRDYRARMKHVLVAQGVLSHATVRGPTSQVTEEDRRTINALVERHGLRDARYSPSGR